MKGAISMSEIIRRAVAGTMESSDVFVELEPGDNGIEIDLDSVVIHQYGDDIRRVVGEVMTEQGVEHAKIHLVDRGALDCVIRARVETAILRAKGE